jgi:hypothetical protein
MRRRTRVEPESARSPHCRCELPATPEQRMFLAEGRPAYLFCTICMAHCSGRGFVAGRQPARGGAARRSRRCMALASGAPVAVIFQ